MSLSSLGLRRTSAESFLHPRVRIGVIGLEGFGRIRAADLALRVPHAELVAISSRSLREARECAKNCGIQRAVLDQGSLLLDPEIDALVIASPVENRADLVVQAARAGKPILVAPPIDLDPAHVDRAIRANFERAGSLQVGFHRRFDPRALNLRRVVREGGLGRIARLRIQRRMPAREELGQANRALLPNEALIHALDLLRFVSDEEVVELMASRSAVLEPRESRAGANPRPMGIATTVVTAALSGGGLATLEIFEGPGTGQSERIEIEGSRASLGKGEANMLVPISGSGEFSPTLRPRFASREAAALLAESRSFVEALRWGRPVAVGPHEAREASILLEASRRALILGRSIRPDDVAADLLP